MTSSRPSISIFKISSLALFISLANGALAADVDVLPDAQLDESTVTYPAQFFDEFSPVSVNDMIDRIPGIGLALRGGNQGRGLGSGSGEVLINGQRLTGKSNSSRSQLSRIGADQVEYIEIIRGTSEELGVRGSGQVVNIVLTDAQSRSSIAAEVNMDRLRDGTVDPGAKLSFTGQNGDFNYLFHIEAEPRYGYSESFETSRDAEGELLETRFDENTFDNTEFQTSMNLGYRFGRSTIQLNALYGTSSPPFDKDRVIQDFTTGETRREREHSDNSRSNWEIGGDYEIDFAESGRFRFLFVVNDRDNEYTRERFTVAADNSETKNLFIFNSGRDRERIGRASYTWDLASNQGLELGLERAQTIRNSGLLLGTNADGSPSASVGGLVQSTVGNANSEVEEIRYETFLVHNWQLNPRMSLESSLILENSTITQGGDVNNERDFDFIRPGLDYRFDITPSLQLRANVKKDVSQLSFSDFSASTDNSDDEQDTQAGNPDIVQEQAWAYSFNLEYRLPNSIGVLNSQVYYRDIEDTIDRIDVSSSPTNLQSARGNIGDATRSGINIDASANLGYIGLPSAILSLGFSVADSEVVDPFLGETRRLRNNGRHFGRLNFRHDITDWNLSYGFGYASPSKDRAGRTNIDIDDIERDIPTDSFNAFVEKKAFNGITFRFEANNLNDASRCRERTRFFGATIDGIVEEVEHFCRNNGVQYALKMRANF